MGPLIVWFKEWVWGIRKRLTAYIRRLLLPIYLFPFKLVTYSLYYVVKLLLGLTWGLLGLMVETFIYPFRSFKNLWKSVFALIVLVYLVASVFVIADYLQKQYGWWGKFLCAYGTKERLQQAVVRVVGGYSEGSGFFIADNQVLTNFHVIATEPSPKIIFPDGRFITPTKIIGNKDADLAILFTEHNYPDLVLSLPDKIQLAEDEPLIATGYPLGTILSGEATVTRGNFISYRRDKHLQTGYIQTNIGLVQGMSGGPLTDQCGQVEGINTLSLAGMSLFIMGSDAKEILSSFTDQNIKKIEVNPSESPAEAVRAFYIYLKARRMQEGYNLLSNAYLQQTNFEEWTNRFTDILDVNVIKTGPYQRSKDTAYVKFTTKNWVDGETEIHYYEGMWQTVNEDGVYKMNKSNIAEITNPSWDWFYE